MEDPGINIALITKYLSREADQDESAVVERWISEADNNRAEFEKFREAWDRASAYAGFGNWNSEKRKIEFLRKIADQERNERLRMSVPEKNRLRSAGEILKYAAAVILLAVLGIIVSKTLDKEPQLAGTTTVSASRGSKTEMILSDGSKVLLNAGSTLRYEGSFNSNGRDVYLEGEGYFEVRSNESRPFRVHAGKVVVEALGTIFNVKAYPDEDNVETTLVEGIVTVEAAGRTDHRITLSPNEQANYYKPGYNNPQSDSFLIIRGVNTSQNISWINDQLIITNESLGSLAVKLGRKYDVKFNFADTALTQLRYTGTLDNETIEQVLDILKISSPLDYRIEKREIWLFPDQK